MPALRVHAGDASANPRDDVARTLVGHLLAERFEAATEPFDATLRRALTANQLAAAWQQTRRLHGKAIRIGDSRAERIGGYDVVFVACECERATFDVKVVFDRENRITGLFFQPSVAYRPPDYVDPECFTERPATIGRGLFRLPGTFCVPENHGETPGKFPAMVLIHGSGPHDRDETIGPNKPFRDLAEGLASRGIAVLRYEKRTKAHPLSLAFSRRLTVREETIDDAAEAVAWLMAQPEVDRERIFVLGHSLGGFLLPRLATVCESQQLPVAGWISLAGSTRPLDVLIDEQTRYLAQLDGEIDADERAALDSLRQQLERARSPELTPDTPTLELPLGIPASYWLDLRGYDPTREARSMGGRLLFLQGKRDYQVTKADFEGWKRALKDRPNTTFCLYPDLNHLFLPGTGLSQPAEYFVPGHIAIEVIMDVARWVHEER